MQKPSAQLSTSQQWFVTSLYGVFAACAVTGGNFIVQAVSTGNYDIQSIARSTIPVILSVLSLGWAQIISNPKIQQVEADTINQIEVGLAQGNLITEFRQELSSMYHSLLGQIAAQPQPIVHIHNDVPVAAPSLPPQGGNVIAPASPVTPVPVQSTVAVNPLTPMSTASSTWQPMQLQQGFGLAPVPTSNLPSGPIQDPFSPTLASLIPVPTIPVSINPPQNISDASTQVVPSVASVPDRWSTASLQAMQTQG